MACSSSPWPRSSAFVLTCKKANCRVRKPRRASKSSLRWELRWAPFILLLFNLSRLVKNVPLPPSLVLNRINCIIPSNASSSFSSILVLSLPVRQQHKHPNPRVEPLIFESWLTKGKKKLKQHTHTCLNSLFTHYGKWFYLREWLPRRRGIQNRTTEHLGRLH